MQNVTNLVSFLVDSWPLKMGLIGCPETSVRNYRYNLHNNPEECRSLAFFLFIVCRVFASSSALCNTYSDLTPSVQLIFSFLFQQHISKLSRYFWSTYRSVQVLAPYKSMLQMVHFSTFFLEVKSSLLVKRVFFLLNAALATAIQDFISYVHLASFILMLPNFLQYFTFFGFFDLSYLYWVWLPWDSHYLSFFIVNFHSIASSTFI